MNSSTVIVTGAAGLIGSAVTRRLVQEGIRVIACDDFSNGIWRLEHKNICWKRIDIVSSCLADEFRDTGASAVIHCAAHPGGRSLAEPSENVRVNCFGSMRIFEWCARSGIPVIYLSSSIVYGDQPPVPIPESAALNPGTIYAVCKVACENYLRVLDEGYGLQWTVLRLFATYGENHRPNEAQGIVNVMLTQLFTGNRVLVKGSVRRIRDMMYVEDAAEIILKCLFEERTRGFIINAGTGTGYMIEEMIYLLGGLLGRKRGDIEIVESDSTIGDPLYSVPNITRLKGFTGFVPKYNLRNGLERLALSLNNSKS